MPQFAKSFLFVAALAALAAVILGAFGAHGLRNHIAPELLSVYHTGVEYHFYHALGLFAVGLIARDRPESTALRWAGTLMILGILIFSGSLYILAVTGLRWIGMITPIGGLAFIAAWAMLAIGIRRL